MALKVIDKEAVLKFVPKCEEKSDNPTTFHISMSDMRDKIKFKSLIDFDSDMSKPKLKGEDEDWIDYLCMRIRRIENIQNGDGLISIEGVEAIKETLVGLEKNSYLIGLELFGFLMENSGATEEQAGN